MSDPFDNAENTEDLHLLMAVAVLCGHKGVTSDMQAVYEIWSKCYPTDALGGIGRGLTMIGNGRPREGYRLIEETARTAETRGDQAKEVLSSLQRDMRELVNG
ncbi:MAG: hypothetical protein AAGA87_02465 [Pseudomonadota bacterium]